MQVSGWSSWNDLAAKLQYFSLTLAVPNMPNPKRLTWWVVVTNSQNCACTRVCDTGGDHLVEGRHVTLKDPGADAKVRSGIITQRDTSMGQQG
eukprot:CAMPEP_0174363634 /NCGR_PEP_ID=MMETSP0811_2-20130205/69595_1 /TAXON_ID=73025 ORGANISM="Eutreptiella gymnastica-like, Strain CCMP1594" /NCGR_SAMPLE_ID=MMETSP0811_2 /ASSEMBLY_ACC=CAM_ASM_000667 /LENGTH=92 /DNA_ID=CAMNT_0015502495 /DNA_START=150 /DNA_END=425 /DNA_ORIENTATION=-